MTETEEGPEPEPTIGSAGSLGPERDTTDANVIHALAPVLATSDHVGAARRVMREAVWFLWESPRLPRPLVGGKYPRRYPWSPGAHAIVEASAVRPRGGWGLIIEHAIPRNLLVQKLLDDASGRTPQETLSLLIGGTHAAVISRSDDARLTAAGLRDRIPADADPTDNWARYRAAGLDPSTFRCLDQPAELDTPPEALAAPATWSAWRSLPRLPATRANVALAPGAPGVYVWFRDGEPMYLGISQNLRARLRTHRSTRTRPARSTLRASVGMLVTGQERNVLRTKSRYLPEEAAQIDAWLDECEIVWATTPSRDDARQIEIDLCHEWRPPLNIS